MSFILDAIAKSERERQQQEIPDARILVTPISHSRRARPNLPYYVLGALLLVMIVVFIWIQADRSPFNRLLQLKHGSIESASTQGTASDNAHLAGEAPHVEISDSKAVVKQLVKVPDEKIQTADSTTSNPNLYPDATINLALPTRGQLAADQSISGKEDTGDSLESNTELKPAEKKTHTENVSTPGTATVVEPDTQPDSIATRQMVIPDDTASNGASVARSITRLSELPADVRRDLPSVSFSGHLFSKNENLSYVMVDGGRSVIAGQQIAEELFLHKVTPTGAIVDFRGFLIETGILQNWSLK